MGSRRFEIHTCYWCGKREFEDNMLEYNDHHFCSLVCKLKQERKEDEELNRIDCASDVIPLRPGPR